MPPTTDIDLKEVRDLIIGLREEVRVGFAQVDTKLAQMDTKFVLLKSEITAEIQRVESKTDVKFAELGGKIDVIDERTKLGFWGFIGRGLIVAIFVLFTSFAIKYFLFGTVKL